MGSVGIAAAVALPLEKNNGKPSAFSRTASAFSLEHTTVSLRGLSDLLSAACCRCNLMASLSCNRGREVREERVHIASGFDHTTTVSSVDEAPDRLGSERPPPWLEPERIASALVPQ